MSDELPADWAIDKAYDFAWPARAKHTAAAKRRMCTESPSFLAFARYIEAHEEPPVDPLVAEAKHLTDYYFDNKFPTSWEFALACLRRGIELAEGGAA